MELPEDKKVTGLDIVKVMLGHCWPNDDAQIRKTVVTSLVILVSAKILNTGVPFIFSHAVDTLNSGQLSLDTPGSSVTTLVMATLLGFGAARAGALGLNELRNAVFARVAQHSIRKIAQNVFRHLHNLDLGTHHITIRLTSHNILSLQLSISTVRPEHYPRPLTGDHEASALCCLLSSSILPQQLWNCLWSVVSW